jgi:hypothetical protein
LCRWAIEALTQSFKGIDSEINQLWHGYHIWPSSDLPKLVRLPNWQQSGADGSSINHCQCFLFEATLERVLIAQIKIINLNYLESSESPLWPTCQGRQLQYLTSYSMHYWKYMKDEAKS